jgi:hypothetical protein
MQVMSIGKVLQMVKRKGEVSLGVASGKQSY